jgi:SsrA-binding protein
MVSKQRAKKPPGNRPVAQNRKARHDYEILDTVEAGMVLVGSEVKSLREGRAQLREAYARVEDGEVWLFGVHIPPYSFAAAHTGHVPERKRKLLLHRRQIEEFGERAAREHLTLVPLAIYFREGKAKIEIALAKGRKHYDKRAAIAKRDETREAARSVAARRRGEE